MKNNQQGKGKGTHPASNLAISGHKEKHNSWFICLTLISVCPVYPNAWKKGNQQE